MIESLPLLQAAAANGRIPWHQSLLEGLGPLDTAVGHLPWDAWLDVPWWGPLDTILRDPNVHDVYINGPLRPVLVGRGGMIDPTPICLHPEWIAWLQRRMLATRIGATLPIRPTIEVTSTTDRRVPPPDPLSALERVPLYGGVTRGDAGIRRLRFALTTDRRTPDGPTITLRVVPDVYPDLAHLVQQGMLPREVADLLQRAIRAKVTILVVGGTGSGKTTLTAALKQALHPQRSVVVQDSPELPTGGEANDVSYLVEDGDTQAFLACVRHALRQQPDRIIIGEGRGPELLAMIEGAATGHPGLTTIHAATAADAVLRLETCASMAPDTRPEIVRANLAKLALLVIAVERIGTTRMVTEVAELRPGSSPRPGDPYELGVSWTLQHGQLQRTPDPIRARWAQEVVS